MRIKLIPRALSFLRTMEDDCQVHYVQNLIKGELDFGPGRLKIVRDFFARLFN
jgi:hypothetical protein